MNPSGLGPGLIGQIPSMNVAGGGFMSQWQTGQVPSQNPQFSGNFQGVSQFGSDANQFQNMQFGKDGFQQIPQPRFCGGGCVGGCTPQVQQMNQLLSLSQGLSGPQLMTLNNHGLISNAIPLSTTLFPSTSITNFIHPLLLSCCTC